MNDPAANASVDDPWASQKKTRPDALADEAAKVMTGPAPAIDGAGDGPAEADVAAASFEFVKQLAIDLSSDELDLPALPDVVNRIKAVLEDDNSTADTIAKVVGTEPVLAARLLTMANSAGFGGGIAEIRDLRTAVGRLGHVLIRTSAMSYAMRNLMDAQSMAELKQYLTRLWSHSLRVAAIANSIAKRQKSTNADEATFVGLIHDIGKLYILTRLKDHPELARCPDAVEQILEEWHPEIGKAIVERWGLSEHVSEAVAEHENVEREHVRKADILDVLIAANVLAKAAETRSLESLDLAGSPVFERLGIDGDTVQELISDSREELDELMSALKG